MAQHRSRLRLAARNSGPFTAAPRKHHCHAPSSSRPRTHDSIALAIRNLGIFTRSFEPLLCLAYLEKKARHHSVVFTQQATMANVHPPGYQYQRPRRVPCRGAPPSLASTGWYRHRLVSVAAPYLALGVLRDGRHLARHAGRLTSARFAAPSRTIGRRRRNKHIEKSHHRGEAHGG